jgi:hypothetical protein
MCFIVSHRCSEYRSSTLLLQVVDYQKSCQLVAQGPLAVVTKTWTLLPCQISLLFVCLIGSFCFDFLFVMRSHNIVMLVTNSCAQVILIPQPPK